VIFQINYSRLKERMQGYTGIPQKEVGEEELTWVAKRNNNDGGH